MDLDVLERTFNDLKVNLQLMWKLINQNSLFYLHLIVQFVMEWEYIKLHSVRPTKCLVQEVL